MKNAKCTICNYVVKKSIKESSCCPQCGTDFTASTMEKRIMGASGTYTPEDKRFFGKMGMNASINLTDKRLLIIPEKLEGFNLTTVLTAVIINKMTSRYGIISIPLEQIKAVRDGKSGLIGKAIIIDTTNGKLLKIIVSKQKSWKEAIIKIAPNL